MPISIPEAAAILQVSPRRVQQLVSAGRYPARKVGGVWMLDADALAEPRRAGRPMSVRVAWALLDVLGGGPGAGVSQPEQSRLRRRIRELRELPDRSRVEQLRSWLPNRARRVQLSAAPPDLADLRNDGRLVLSGVSDPRSRMSSAAWVEGYAAAEHADALRADFLMSARGRPNVVLHVVAAERPVPDVSAALLAADLADWAGPREQAAAARILRELLP